MKTTSGSAWESNPPDTRFTSVPTALKTVGQSTQPVGTKQLTETPKDCVAFCVALLSPNCPELASVVDAWDDLPEAVKAGIVAMVQAAGGNAGEDR